MTGVQRRQLGNDVNLDAMKLRSSSETRDLQQAGKLERTPAHTRVLSQFNPGNDLLSHPLEVVPSALEGLTALFGMGRGVAPPPWSPGIQQ